MKAGLSQAPTVHIKKFFAAAKKQVALAKEGAARAGVGADVDVRFGDASTISLRAAPNVVVSNPYVETHPVEGCHDISCQRTIRGGSWADTCW